jgi:predicted lipoprotein with Yx(FWY)xxD motif
LALVTTSLAACGAGRSESVATSGTNTLSGPPSTIGLANTHIGTVLVDSTGRTLYAFTKDQTSTSACSGQCVIVWSPLRTTRHLVVGSGLGVSLVATSARPDGQPQVTYNGHRLYRFSDDNRPGEANGQGLASFGGVWLVLSPAGREIPVQPSAAGTRPAYSAGFQQSPEVRRHEHGNR